MERSTWRVGRILAVAVALGLVLFWLWIFAGGPKKQNPDYLADRAWVQRAQDTCRATVDRIDALPPASESTDNVARAQVVDRANDELETMLDQLAARRPTGDGDEEVVQPWLADWRTYLGNRRDYADRLANDPGAQLLVDEKFHDSIETVIGTFAEVNDMPACAPPGDVA
jgi:ABC-type transporter Mla subunit MlaD